MQSKGTKSDNDPGNAQDEGSLNKIKKHPEGFRDANNLSISD
jgi:hypothetical protein